MWGGGYIFQKTVFLESVQDNEDTRNRGPSIRCAETVKRGVGGDHGQVDAQGTMLVLPMLMVEMWDAAGASEALLRALLSLTF